MGNDERLAEETRAESNGAEERHMPSQSVEPVLSEIGIAESMPDAENAQDPTPSESGSSPQRDLKESLGLRPLSISKSRAVSDALGPAVLDALGPAVSDVQEFDFWSKPGKLLEQAADGQPVSSPKLWSHGGGARVTVASQEGAGALSPSTPLADAFNLRDSYVLTEGFGPLECAEVGEFGEEEVGVSGANPRGADGIEQSENGEVGKEERARKAGVVPSAEPGGGRNAVVELEQQQGSLSAGENDAVVGEHCEEIGAGTSANKAESTSCAFVTKPAASSSSTFDSAFSVSGPSRKPSHGANGPSSDGVDGAARRTGVKSAEAQAEGFKRAVLEPPVVPKERAIVRTVPGRHLSDSASVSSSTPSQPEARKHGDSKSTASSASDTTTRGVRGRGSEVASTSGRTGADSPKAGPEHLIITPPVSRPLYTDTPAMANDVVFGVSTFGKLGRANSFATGSIKGATVFAPDGLGQRKTHSEPKRVSFQLGAAEGKKVGGGVVPGSPRSPKSPTSDKLKEGGQSAEGSSRGVERGGSGSRGLEESQKSPQERQKGDQQRGGAESKDTGLRPGASRKAEVDVDVDRGKAKVDADVRRSLASTSEGGSPKVIDRSALFKKWLEKNKEELAQSEGGKGLAPTPILQRIGSSNDVLPPASARHSDERYLKRTTSHSAIDPPPFKPSGEIQSLEGGYDSPTPSPRRKSSSTPSSPVGTPPGKHSRQLSIGSSKPPKAPKSPPTSPLPPKHPHSPSSKPRDPPRSPREKQPFSLGPATIDATVDLGPSSAPGFASPPLISRNLGRLPPARIPSPKTNSVLRKAMSQSKAETSIPVGALLVDAGLPADAKDAVPQLIARIIKATSQNPPLQKQAALTAPKLSQVAPLPQKGGKNSSGSQPENPPPPSPSDTAPVPEDGAFPASLMSLSPRALLRSTSLPSYLQSVLPTSLLNSFSAQVSLTAPEPKRLTAPPNETSPSLEDSILLLGKLALAGEFEQEHGRALLAQAKGPVTEILLMVLERGSHEDREAAAGLTRVLTLLEEGRNALLESDGLKLLVDVLWSGTPRGKVQAASSLRNLAYKSTGQKRAIMAAGAIGPLVSLLRSTTQGAPEAAAGALRSLAMADGMEEIIVQNGAIPPLVRLLHNPQSPAAKEASAATLQNLATDDAHRGQIVQAGAVPALFKMLLAPEISSQMAAAGALRNLAAGGGEYQKAIGESGAVGPLIKILGKRGPNVPAGMPEAAAGALANLALFDANKPLISGEGGIPALTELVKSGTPPAQLVGMEALKNLATDAEISHLIVQARAAPWLVRNLKSSERRLQRAAVRVLHAVCAFPENLEAVKEQGVVPVLEQIVEGQTGPDRDDFIAKLLLQLKSPQEESTEDRPRNPDRKPSTAAVERE
ncbi:Armadillo/beta-catenin-like repeats [Klebsormidium nitens]|uniref:Armadillo/beta-catenin-like repeats n=1 Tax=Klebsormidium nitens TaxID=105231 RepID=A0A1Y1HVV3_KLENI|nr:Armadillo/beta-catenin-like repeats [Klebsormidium nitens]|eukprot:GAQ82745.1 Armadillo/beta-catenin-like repeats [Klebsormidium nitens]